MDSPLHGKTYHHGDLRQAMLAEAARMIESEGLERLSLRGMARAVGVTHAAPANHFGDLTGLLSELAAEGYRACTAALIDAAETAGAGPSARGKAMAGAYLRFARRNPGMFTLMFRGERLDTQRPALKEAMATARQALESAASENDDEDAASALEATARAAARWSLVHGFAVLLLEGRLKGMLTEAGTDEDDLFDAVLDATSFGKGKGA
jgi:AcrR family transcriptional regulator